MCPFLDKCDARCATHLTLANITSAFAHCADEYNVCPVYQERVAELICHDGQYKEPAATVGLLAAS